MFETMYGIVSKLWKMNSDEIEARGIVNPNTDHITRFHTLFKSFKSDPYKDGDRVPYTLQQDGFGVSVTPFAGGRIMPGVFSQEVKRA